MWSFLPAALIARALPSVLARLGLFQPATSTRYNHGAGHAEKVSRPPLADRRASTS